VRVATLLHLYRIRLRSRLVAELLAVAGIAVGVALVFAALVAGASLTDSVRQLTNGLVGDADYQLAARSPSGFDRTVLDRVKRAEGVEWAAPIAEAKANLVGPQGRRSVLLVGGDPRLARHAGSLLRHARVGSSRARPGLALPLPLAEQLGVGRGEQVRVETGSAVAPVRVAGLLAADDVGSLTQSPVALAPLPMVQRLAGVGDRLNRIFVRSAAGRESEVSSTLGRIAAGRLEVSSAAHEVTVFEKAAYPTNRSTDLFSVLSALVGFLFAISAMLLTVPQRRRLIAELRLAGYEPWAIVEILLVDALVLGAVGSLVGLGLGDQVSRHLFDNVPGFLTAAFPIGSQRTITWQTIAIAMATGLVAACIAVLAPIRDALSRNPIQPTAVGQASRRDSWPLVAGVAMTALAAVIGFLVPRAALVAIGLLTAALLFLLPSFLRLSASGFDRIARRTRSPVAILALLELRSGAARVRTLALTGTGAIAVFATVAIGGAHADLERGLAGFARDVDGNAAVWVTLRGADNIFATSSFALPPSELASIERQPGVRVVRRHGGAFLDVGDHRAWVMAPPPSVLAPIPPSQVRAGDYATADERLRAGGWLTLSESIADHLDVGVGDRVLLPAPNPRRFRVAALTTNHGWPGGAIVVNSRDYARAWGSGAPTALGIGVGDGASVARVVRSVEDVLGADSPLLVETRVKRAERQEAASRAGLSRLDQIAALVVIAAALSMTVAMGGVIWQRRRTLAALKVHGFGEAELWRSLLLESALLLGTGCLLGAAFGLFGQLLLDRALEEITGFPVLYATATADALAVFALVSGVAVAMLALPGWLAVRVRPEAGLPT
jgi:putative ABC transport system permease protein